MLCVPGVLEVRVLFGPWATPTRFLLLLRQIRCYCDVVDQQTTAGVGDQQGGLGWVVRQCQRPFDGVQAQGNVHVGEGFFKSPVCHGEENRIFVIDDFLAVNAQCA